MIAHDTKSYESENNVCVCVFVSACVHIVYARFLTKAVKGYEIAQRCGDRDVRYRTCCHKQNSERPAAMNISPLTCNG